MIQIQKIVILLLVGVPHSTGNGTTERDQHLGPRAVRNISAMLKKISF
jgi:guanidinopropionase